MSSKCDSRCEQDPIISTTHHIQTSSYPYAIDAIHPIHQGKHIIDPVQVSYTCRVRKQTSNWNNQKGRMKPNKPQWITEYNRRTLKIMSFPVTYDSNPGNYHHSQSIRPSLSFPPAPSNTHHTSRFPIEPMLQKFHHPCRLYSHSLRSNTVVSSFSGIGRSNLCMLKTDCRGFGPRGRWRSQ